MKNKYTYTVETVPYTESYNYITLKEAKRKRSELRIQGKRAYIVCLDSNGNDYILKV